MSDPPARKLTLSNGRPQPDKLSSLTLGRNGPALLQDVALLEETAHFNRERIPERVVHAKGASAHGYFTKTCAGIERYSRAELFRDNQAPVQVVVRFSHVTGESGISDTLRDFRGFAVRFKQPSEGVWDLVGNNFPVFFIKDAINFSSFIHTQKRNPRTHLRDPNAFWDFVTQLPESLHAITMLFSDRGVPRGFRHMHGYGVNTFKLVNDKQEMFYAKFHWICQQRVESLTQQEADELAGKDPDFMLRDLQTAIEARELPSWKLMFQVMTEAEVAKCSFNPFDATKVWPTAQFPLKEIGVMRLESQASNYFAHVEQLAFSPANMVPGIEPSPDRVLVARMFSYPDAQRYRLGANYQQLPCNAPPKCPFTPTYNDFVTFEREPPPAGMVNYVPSAKLKLASPSEGDAEHRQAFEAASTGRYRIEGGDDFEQPRALINKVMDAAKRKLLAENLAHHLAMVTDAGLLQRVTALLTQLDANLSRLVQEGIAANRK